MRWITKDMNILIYLAKLKFWLCHFHVCDLPLWSSEDWSKNWEVHELYADGHVCVFWLCWCNFTSRCNNFQWFWCLWNNQLNYFQPPWMYRNHYISFSGHLWNWQINGVTYFNLCSRALISVYPFISTFHCRWFHSFAVPIAWHWESFPSLLLCRRKLLWAPSWLLSSYPQPSTSCIMWSTTMGMLRKDTSRFSCLQPSCSEAPFLDIRSCYWYWIFDINLCTCKQELFLHGSPNYSELC